MRFGRVNQVVPASGTGRNARCPAALSGCGRHRGRELRWSQGTLRWRRRSAGHKHYEEQTARALLASLDIVTAVSVITFDFVDNLQVRIGIDSGQVVVGDIVRNVASESKTVTGDTANLAARLQGIAQEGHIVIGASTEALVSAAFELRDLGLHPFKGFADEACAYAVIAERPIESRFEASRGKNLTALVGREHELGLLRERWELARYGEGQVVLLPGEAGIGKSRVVQSVTESIGNAQRFNLRYQCSSHHMNSASHPIP